MLLREWDRNPSQRLVLLWRAHHPTSRSVAYDGWWIVVSLSAWIFGPAVRPYSRSQLQQSSRVTKGGSYSVVTFPLTFRTTSSLYFAFFPPLSNPLNVHRLKRPPPITSIISATITKKENKTSKRIELQRKYYAWAATACLLRNAMRIRWDGHLKARWKKKIIIKK